jgi:peptidoglycan/LPS O-acetylase OafA/YrhL
MLDRMLNSLRSARLPFLDQIRALAICAVVVQHYHSDWLPGGGIGVGLFFALSGFLITGLLMEMQLTARAAASFITRRFLRVFPALLVSVTAAVALMGLRWPEKVELAHRSYLAVIAFWQMPQDWLGFAFGVLWTLHVEFWFYVLVTLAMLALGKGRAFAWACVAAVVMSIACQLLIPFKPNPLGLDGFAKWAGCLALGAGVAWAWKRGMLQLSGRQARIAIGAGLAGAACLLIFPPATRWVWFLEAFAASSCGALILAGYVAAPEFRLPLPLEPVGRVSYSMYLLHGLLLDYGAVLGLGMGPLPFAAVLLAISAASFRLIERPGMQAHRIWTSRRAAA